MALTRNKKLLVCYGLLLLITSIIVIIVAAVMYALKKPNLDPLAEVYLDYSPAAILLLVCGIIGLFLGCFYTCLLQKDDGKVTAMWSILLILFVAEFIAACMCMWYKMVGEKNLKYFLTPKNDEVPEYLNKIQQEQECCGYNGQQDYKKVPGSCCRGGHCGDNTTKVVPFAVGCGSVFESPMNALAVGIGITAFFAALVSLWVVLILIMTAHLTVMTAIFWIITYAREDLIQMMEEWLRIDPPVDIMIDLQKEFECCGMNGVQDYWEKEHVIPKSCCKSGLNDTFAMDMPNCTYEAPDLYERGCYSQIHSPLFEFQAIVAFGSTIGSAISIYGICLCIILELRAKPIPP